ncbi:DUF1090 domain-containing protein [Variovorax saccharolyticus]|uniref:DUF1090 domain-containing protein n=1 Tax=Variovorax saccharolyticus TaxID=3053516 RepID=UPI002576AFF8|nr:DUF1090 domain-containing protein [Variovorax sp. J22R187]MDM0019405.1 DUF1090 domain-containing protein [Variovorax sp. J22R187]
MKIQSFLLAAALASIPAWAAAEPVPGGTCQGKRQEISRNLDEAKAKGQKQRVRGLEQALSELDAHCTDAKLQAEHRKRIQRQEQAVAARERELKEAERDGSAKKVERRKSKLQEEQAKLQQLKESKSE